MSRVLVISPPRRRTQGERKAETRARLVDAAASLFAERGIEAVSVDAVAAAAGRTSGAVYAHFGSKQGMLVALLDEWRHLLLGVVTRELDRATTLEERLRAVAANVVVHPSDETRRMMALERELWRIAARDARIAQAMRARAADARGRMAAGFASWQEAGLIDTCADPLALADAFRALVVGLELQQRIDPVLDVESATLLMALVAGSTTDVVRRRVTARRQSGSDERETARHAHRAL
jgi:AcrR family transcriptional regulator